MKTRFDFDEFYEILTECGWAFHDMFMVSDGKRSGVRYMLDKYDEDAAPAGELTDRLRERFGEDVVVSVGHHRYAPELKSLSVVGIGDFI